MAKLVPQSGRSRVQRPSQADSGAVLASDVGTRPEGPIPDLADRLFDQWSPYPGLGLRHHCLRIFTFIELQQARGDVGDGEYDRGLIYALAMLHDVGLFVEGAEGQHYQQRSAALILDRLGPALPRGEQRDVVRAAILRNHHIRAVRDLPPLVEMFRRAVWIEHSFGLLRFGFSRAEIVAVQRRYPRDNFSQVMADFWWRTIRREPWSILRGIFFPAPEH